MAAAVVASVSVKSTDSNTVTTANIDTTGADLIVVGTAFQTGSAPSLTDSKGNTWTEIGSALDSGGVKMRRYYCVSPTVGSGHNFTVTGTGIYPSIEVIAFSGSNPVSTLDQQNGTTNASASSLQPGSVTPSESNEIAVVFLGMATTTSASIDGGFTIAQSQVGGGFGYGSGIAYQFLSSAAALNPTWTINASASIAVAIATFRVPAAVVALSWRPEFPDVLLDTTVEMVESGFTPRAPQNPFDPTPN